MLSKHHKTMVKKGESDSSGVDCKFLDLKNGWGIKCYDQKERRDRAFKTQKYVAKLGLAPEVEKCYDIGESFCYVTEVVETIVDYGDIDYHLELEDDFNDNDEWIEEKCECLNEFYKKTNRFYYCDSHVGNFGRKNGKLIIIDFDKCISNEKGEYLDETIPDEVIPQ